MAIGLSHSIKNAALKSIHAEDEAVNKFIRLNHYRRILESHDKVDIFVTRINGNGMATYSRPCRNCLLRIQKCKLPINNIYYTDHDGSIRMEKFNLMIDSELTVMSKGDRKKLRYVRK